MDLFGTIYNRLTTDATVGPIIGDRVYTSIGVDGIWPQVVVQIDHEEDEAIDASSAQDFAVMIEASALTSQARADLADAIDACLDRQTWEDDDTGVAIRSVARTTDVEDSVVQDSGNADRIYFYRDLEYKIGAEGTKDGS